MAIGTSAVQRAVAGITLGTVSAYDTKKVEDWKGGLDEYDQQYRVNFKAIVDYQTRWVTASVGFNVAFVAEPARESPYFATPTFTSGWEFSATRDNNAGPSGLESRPVLVTICLVGYRSNDDNTALIGASVMIGMCNPGVRKKVLAAGVAHLNFQGYGAPMTDDLLSEDGE